MTEKLHPTSTLQLIFEFFAQIRQLLNAEVSLARAELSENASSLTSGLAALVAAGVLMFAGLIVLLLAAGLFLLRFGVPPDLAFLIVAGVTFLVGWLLIRVARRRLKPDRLMPNRSIAQASLLFGRRV